eukprot:TRINITY_DN15077_c0_g3_i1.p1 TRINITY_DN15077_c0_g3~~TRINITY_DN15077_c0_g3_i1.p1  ORF type:complete len:513 (+),score=112.39 TRINITY_DN15077_c0_g3_i1:144-1682(+)
MVSQGVGGHEGMSGTPMWKIREQYQAQREQAMQESLAYVAERSKPTIPPNVLIDASTIGGGESSSSSKPLCRHVLVKDFRKVCERSKVDLPDTGLFQNKSPMGLYALFDGQSGTGEPGPAAAEYCARNFHKKVMENLASLPGNATSDTFVKAALVKSFEDLDKEMLETQPDIQDGCGAAVALLIGDYIFSAVVGLCSGMISEGGKPRPLGKNQGRPALQEERARVARAGAQVVGAGEATKVLGPGGLTSPVSRSLGDFAWKRLGMPVISCIPEISSIKLSWAEQHSYLMLNSKPVSEALTDQDLFNAAKDFHQQPRAATGEIVTQAQEKNAASQSTAVQVCFLPGGPTGGADDGSSSALDPAAKKLKLGNGAAKDMTSARLRHILIKTQDQQKVPDPSGKKAPTRLEAEALMRTLTKQLKAELEELRKKNRGRKPEDIALRSTKFMEFAKKHSACASAQKGGGMCGDLGWVTKEQQIKYGGSFRESVAPLRPGEYSDIVLSNDGLHLLQRIA